MWTRRGRSTQEKSVSPCPECRFSCKKNEKAANNNKHQQQKQQTRSKLKQVKKLRK